MTWNDLTVWQFIQINKLSKETGIDDFTKAQKAVCIIYDKTELELDRTKFRDYKQMETEAGKFLNEAIPVKRVRTIRAGKRRFRLESDLTKLEYRQYVEVLFFGKDPIENMHLVVASVVKPVNMFGIVKNNKVSDHKEVAELLLNASVVDIHNACVFFCKLFMALIRSTKDYLVREIMSKSKMKKSEAEKLITDSINTMGGFFQQPGLPNMKG